MVKAGAFLLRFHLSASEIDMSVRKRSFFFCPWASAVQLITNTRDQVCSVVEMPVDVTCSYRKDKWMSRSGDASLLAVFVSTEFVAV